MLRARTALLLLAVASCNPRHETATPASIIAPPPTPPACDPLLATTLQRITRIPYRLDRQSYVEQAPVFDLDGEVVEAFVYNTEEKVLTTLYGSPRAFEAFALIVTRKPTGARPAPSEQDAARRASIDQLRKAAPRIALSGGREARLLHLPGFFIVDIPRADGKTALHFIWGGIPEGKQPPPDDLKAWERPYTDHTLDEWRRVATELDACGPP